MNSVPHATFEIHLDGREIDEATKSSLLSAGMEPDSFVNAGGGLELPKFHMTWQREEELVALRKQLLVLQRKVADIRQILDDGHFVGYLEAEFIPPGNQIDVCWMNFDDSHPFPIREKLPLVTPEMSNKVSDLHIKIPLQSLDPRLEHYFDRAGVYWVDTPKRNRIYTLQFLSNQDGETAFDLFKAYFAVAGGCTELTYERCTKFVRYPSKLPVAPVVERGFFTEQLVHKRAESVILSTEESFGNRHTRTVR